MALAPANNQFNGNSTTGGSYTVWQNPTNTYNTLLTRGVGFNNQFKFLEEILRMTVSTNYPPYNIVQSSDTDYEIQFAIAGFSKKEITVETKQSILTVKGTKINEDDRTFLHRGVAARDFEQNFPLADYVEVVDAEIKDGMLIISLQRNLPEELKTKTVKIK